MRSHRFVGYLLVVALAATLLATRDASAQTRAALTSDDVEKMMTELSNWGRWGAEDQLGTVNLITPEKRAAAARLVTDGVCVSLAHDVEKERAADNSQPFGHTISRSGGEYSNFFGDTYTITYHGFCHSHLDSLCHMLHHDKMYNGYPRDSMTDKGATKLGIENFKLGIFTRGILVDMPKLKGVRFLEPGTSIYPEDLDAWEKLAGLKVSPGDVLLLRTGRWARRAAMGPWDLANNSAGLHASCARWLKQRGVAIIGSDVTSDVIPSGVEGIRQPIHQLVIVAMGMPIFDNLDLEAVAEASAKRNRWEFLLTAAPLAVPGGTGSPLNPIATY